MARHPNRESYSCANPKQNTVTNQARTSQEAVELQWLRVRHEITGIISRDDFRVSQGAKSAHTGSMEAMSDAGAAEKRHALKGEADLWPPSSLLLGPIVQLCSLVAPCHGIKFLASQLFRLFRDGPLGK